MRARCPIRLVASTLALGAATTAAAEVCPGGADGVAMPGLFLRIPVLAPSRRAGLGIELSYNCVHRYSPLRYGALTQAELGFDGGARFALAPQAGPGTLGMEAGVFVDRLAGETGVGLHLAPYLSLGLVWTALRISFGGEQVYTDLVLGAKLPLGFDQWSPWGDGDATPGRPLRDGDAAVLPRLWAEGRTGGWRCIALDTLEPPARAWAQQALAERASVDAFLKIASELRGLGAPHHLLWATIRAAAEELSHTARCLAHASHLAGVRLRTEPVPWPARTEAPGALRARLIHEALHDGLVGEREAAAEARLAADWLRPADRAAPPGVSQTLHQIVREESQHAALAADIIRFCLATGGGGARDALADAARALSPVAPRSVDRAELGWLSRVGQRPRQAPTDPRRAWRWAQAALATT